MAVATSVVPVLDDQGIDYELALHPKNFLGNENVNAVPESLDHSARVVLFDESLFQLSRVCFVRGEHERLICMNGDQFIFLLQGHISNAA